MKWANYSAFNCTWEPERYLSSDIVQEFKCPSTPPPGLADARDEFLLGTTLDCAKEHQITFT